MSSKKCKQRKKFSTREKDQMKKKITRPSNLPSFIPPRNFLIPILRMKGAKGFTNKRKELSRRLCRLNKWMFKHNKEAEE
jgi:hypothetical protein